QRVVRLVNEIMVTVLIGIKIAANNGDIVPCTAKLSPTTLYVNDMAKLMCITLTASFAKAKNDGNLANESPSKIASQPGEKLLISSDTAIPKSAFRKAPASLSPSPNIHTCFPCSCQKPILCNLSEGLWLNSSRAVSGKTSFNTSERLSLSPEIKCRSYSSLFNVPTTSINPSLQDCSKVK